MNKVYGLFFCKHDYLCYMANQKGIKPTYSLKSLRFENFKEIK